MTQLQKHTLYVLSRDRRGLFSWWLPRNTSFSPKPWRIPSVFKTGSLSYVQGKWNRVDFVAPNHFGRGDQRYKDRSRTSYPIWSRKQDSLQDMLDPPISLPPTSTDVSVASSWKSVKFLLWTHSLLPIPSHRVGNSMFTWGPRCY